MKILDHVLDHKNKPNLLLLLFCFLPKLHCISFLFRPLCMLFIFILFSVIKIINRISLFLFPFLQPRPTITSTKTKGKNHQPNNKQHISLELRAHLTKKGIKNLKKDLIETKRRRKQQRQTIGCT